MRASQHLDAARQQDELARETLAYPDGRPAVVGSVYEAGVAVPWTRTWDTRVDHERLAQVHRGAAAQLQAEYEEACAGRSALEASSSPIARFAIGATPTDDGMIVYLSANAGAPDRLLADMRCHRAWMMLAPSGMDDCPLDLAEVRATVRGSLEEIEVTIKVSDPALVGELQRRVARELEAKRAVHSEAP